MVLTAKSREWIGNSLMFGGAALGVAAFIWLLKMQVSGPVRAARFRRGRSWIDRSGVCVVPEQATPRQPVGWAGMGVSVIGMLIAAVLMWMETGSR